MSVNKRKALKEKGKRRRLFKRALKSLVQQKRETTKKSEIDVIDRKTVYYENQIKRL